MGQETMANLKADPELKPMLEKLETGSPEEVSQIYKDEKFLAKIRERMGESQFRAESPKVGIIDLPKSCQSIAASVIRSKEMQEKIQKLKYDPELKSAFLEMEKGGPADLMKYYNNNEFLTKVRAKLGHAQNFSRTLTGVGIQCLCRAGCLLGTLSSSFSAEVLALEWGLENFASIVQIGIESSGRVSGSNILFGYQCGRDSLRH